MIRIGVIGAGSWAARCHIPALVALPDVEVVVVARRDPVQARRIADRFGIANWTTEWRDALQFELDGVVVASPPAAHEPQVTAALDSGVNVLSEKPFAITSDSAWRMVAKGDEAGRALLVSFGWNYMPIFQAARALLQEPGIGRIEFLSLLIVDQTRSLLTSGRPYRSASTEFPPHAATYRDPSLSGGGVAAVTMSHAFALLSYLTNLEAIELYARLAGLPIDLHDAMTLAFDGGAVGTIAGSSAPDAGLTVGWHVRIVGDRGEVLIDSARGEVSIATPFGTRTAPLGPDAGTYEPTGPARRLAAVCRGEAVGEESPGRIGALAVELTEAAYRSAAEGRPVRLSRNSSRPA